MELISKLWPLSFKVQRNHYASFFLWFFVYAVVCFALELLSGLVAPVIVLGSVLYVIYVAVEVYCVIGVVLCVFRLFGVIK